MADLIRAKLDNDAAWLTEVAKKPLDEVDQAEVIAEHEAYRAALRAVLDLVAGSTRVEGWEVERGIATALHVEVPS